MKPATLPQRPTFALMKLTDVISFYHLQMPRWLFCDSKYKELSLEAKVAYTFLLNRFQLSRMNGWVNDAGEVYIVFTREDLAREMGQLSESHRKLSGAGTGSSDLGAPPWAGIPESDLSCRRPALRQWCILTQLRTVHCKKC